MTMQGNLTSPQSKGTHVSNTARLEAAIKGKVILPGDPEYDKARALFYGGMDRRPAAILRVTDAEDVARVVSLARDTGQELAVRGGGHSVAGYSVSDGGLLLDLSQMKALEIDAENLTVWAEAGLTAVEYTAATTAKGLVTGFGDTGSVGISGITLGGGVGYLVRKYGLTIDDLLAADIVTADGKLLRIDAQNHPDLFWAIRGGGGNFGVVTRFQFRLHKLDSFVGGMLLLPATADTIAGFVTAAEAAPEELSTIANIAMPAPPMPFLPEEWRGKAVIMAMMAYAGDAESGQRALAPFRALATPIADFVRPSSYRDMYPPEQEGYHPVSSVRTMFIDKVDRSVAGTMLDYLQKAHAFMAVAQLRVLGGAMARVPADATAFAHRSSKIMVNVATIYEDLAQRPAQEAWASEFASKLNQGDAGAYVNFMSDEGPDRVRAAYPGSTWDRLAAIKAEYDPDNLFRLNQNVPPAKAKKNGRTKSASTGSRSRTAKK